jgi:hypothetical protein
MKGMARPGTADLLLAWPRPSPFGERAVERWFNRVIAVSTLLLGVIFAATCWVDEFEILYQKWLQATAWLHPACLFAIGWTFGVSLCGLFAPAQYYQTPSGRAFMQILGEGRVTAFRIKCLLACALFSFLVLTLCHMVFVDY